ncbi:MAG: ComEA family DNA-binding protein [Syntrophomonadaceae bacterium]|nr:ComEA family DNA-binding protein [Syntrophomonadaceae bacterium]
MLQMERRYQIIIFLFLAALLFGGGVKYAQYFLLDNRNPQVINPTSETLALTASGEVPGAEITGENSEKAFIFVHVVGAVNKAGVYQLPLGARVFEALEKAVPSPEADLQLLNLALPLQDGQKIYVPQTGESLENVASMVTPQDTTVALPGMGADLTSTGSGKVNINTASVQELDALIPGIGPTLAQRIMEYRQQNGGFRSIEDIRNVSGIGEKRYAQMKDYLTVR